MIRRLSTTPKTMIQDLPVEIIRLIVWFCTESDATTDVAIGIVLSFHHHAAPRPRHELGTKDQIASNTIYISIFQDSFRFS